MKYYSNLYVSEGLEKKKDKVIARLERRKIQPDLHVILLPECDHKSVGDCKCNVSAAAWLSERRPDGSGDRKRV